MYSNELLYFKYTTVEKLSTELKWIEWIEVMVGLHCTRDNSQCTDLYWDNSQWSLYEYICTEMNRAEMNWVNEGGGGGFALY